MSLFVTMLAKDVAYEKLFNLHGASSSTAGMSEMDFSHISHHLRAGYDLDLQEFCSLVLKNIFIYARRHFLLFLLEMKEGRRD